MREAELAELKKQVDEINDSARNIGRFDPLAYEPDKAANASPPAADAAEGRRPDALTASGETPAAPASASEPAGRPASPPGPEELGTGNRTA
jgi:sec-independent protein translocase protein TatB